MRLKSFRSSCAAARVRGSGRSRAKHAETVRPPDRTETTFQQVLARISDRDLFARPIIITSADFDCRGRAIARAYVEADIV
jgi:hypothetical protein